MTMQFNTLPPQGGDSRRVAEVVRGIMNGKTNNTGTIDLATGWASSTIIYDERISYDSKIVLVPFSDPAEADTLPYGSFYSTSDQFAVSTGGTYVVDFDGTTYANGVYLGGTTSQIFVRNAGVYNIAFTAQLINAANSQEHADIWYRINGSNVADSASRFGLSPRKSSGFPSETLGAMNIFLDLDAGDYVEIAGGVSSTDVSLWHDAASVSPFTRPAIPAFIATVNYVSPVSADNVYVSDQQPGQATITHFANDTSSKTYGYIIVG
jgi:hypothetical protein